MPKRVSVIIGARKKRLKETKAKQDIVEEKPSTAGSDQGARQALKLVQPRRAEDDG